MGKKNKVYRIACTWEMVGEVEVEASSLEEAMQKAYDETDIPDGEYSDGSFEVNEDVCRYYYPDEK
jgi:hypothetical protein